MIELKSMKKIDYYKEKTYKVQKVLKKLRMFKNYM